MTVEADWIRALRAALARRATAPAVRDAALPLAAVALVLRGAAAPEILLIRRAERPGDPWSGHVALPGGRADPVDETPLHTAVRETSEEVGIHLPPPALIGALPVVAQRSARALAVEVRPYLFAVAGDAEPVPNVEVAEAVWIPVAELTAPGAVAEHLHEMETGETLRFPAIDARGYRVWGLTHRILLDFLELWAEV